MITLDQANRIIEAIIKRGAEQQCRPLSVIVVEPGCIVKAFQKEDGSSMVRFEMAFGKAYAALALGRSSTLVRVRNEEKPAFMRYLLSATDNKIFPEGGGMLIRADNGDVVGAVGVTGDTEHETKNWPPSHPRRRFQNRRRLRRHGPRRQCQADEIAEV